MSQDPRKTRGPLHGTSGMKRIQRLKVLVCYIFLKVEKWIYPIVANALDYFCVEEDKGFLSEIKRLKVKSLIAYVSSFNK